MSACLLLLTALLVQDLAAHDNDGCPHNFRRCNDDCLDINNTHTVPCEQGPWGKCLSANFPFFCPLTNTCIKKDQICGEDCFDGSPESFWYDHWKRTSNNWVVDWERKDNNWMLDDDAKDTMASITWNIEIPKWLERYNCNGECKSYLEPCNGACDHPEGINRGGITLNLTHVPTYEMKKEKCGNQCRTGADMDGFHDCGDMCLPQSLPCNGICLNATRGGYVPQKKCGDECRPDNEYLPYWRGCPDGSCRDTTVECDGPLPGNCPEDQILCRYNSYSQGTDFNCRSKESYYACNETSTDSLKHKDETCRRYREQCNGECKPGYMKCLIDSFPGCAHPDEWVKCGEDCKMSEYYHECDGACIENGEMCHGLCPTGYKECQGKCVSVSDSDFIDCNGTCQPISEPCQGKCPEGFFKAESKCVPEWDKHFYYKCEGDWINTESPCNGVCYGNDIERPERLKCRGDRCLKKWDRKPCEGEVCIHKDEACNGTCTSTYKPTACGNTCIEEDDPCEGKCSNEKFPYLCEHKYGGEKCIAKNSIGDDYKDCKDGSDETTLCSQARKCNGTLQCINKPCHEPGQDKCPATVEKKRNRWSTETHKMYYCAEEDQCKLVDTSCGGKCVQDMYGQRTIPIKPKDQFACHDGSKCLKIWSTCDGTSDCPDGSDEICDCQGKSDCKDRIQAVSTSEEGLKREYICKSLDERVMMSEYCDGKEDCTDGSDEEGCDECPGLVRCENGWINCANIPCNNTDTLWSGGLECEATFASGIGKWHLCEENGKEARCVKGAGNAIYGISNFYKGEAIKGELCNDECIGGEAYRCGDECLPHNQYGGAQFTCNGSCDHLNKDKKYKLCGDFCVEEDEIEYSGEYQNTLTCDGECRYLGSSYNMPEIPEIASRKTCNGVCLNGTSDEPWFSCAGGDECFSLEEWCNGVSDCRDGTDESSCDMCPKIRKCQHENHPLVNQTSSKGPRFPDYVCEDEPCGECLDSDTFPCGNSCIPSNKICPVSGLCSSSMFQCGEKCLPIANICDGTVDCVDGSDENDCKDKSGSWKCHGTIQQRSQPCL